VPIVVETRKIWVLLKYYCESYDNFVYFLVKITEKDYLNLMALWDRLDRSIGIKVSKEYEASVFRVVQEE
jgi:hypothetical protein